MVTAIFLFPFILLSQNVKVVKWDAMEKLLEGQDSLITVVNFWATWCKPCVSELPYFNSLNSETHTQGMRIVLVSMDSKSDLKKRVKPLLKKKGITAETWLLDEPKQHLWIDKVSKDWSGAIPMTLVIGPGHSVYVAYEGEFESEKKLSDYIYNTVHQP